MADVRPRGFMFGLQKYKTCSILLCSKKDGRYGETAIKRTGHKSSQAVVLSFEKTLLKETFFHGNITLKRVLWKCETFIRTVPLWKKAIYIKKGKKQLSGLELWSTMVLVVVKICQSLSRGMRRRSGKEKRNIKGSPGINTIWSNIEKIPLTNPLVSRLDTRTDQLCLLFQSDKVDLMAIKRDLTKTWIWLMFCTTAN